MSINKRLPDVIIFIFFINAFNPSIIYPMFSWGSGNAQPAPGTDIKAVVEEVVKNLKENVEYARTSADEAVKDSNKFLALAHHSNDTAIRAYAMAHNAFNETKRAVSELQQCKEAVQKWAPEYLQLAAKHKADFTDAITQAEKVIEGVLKKCGGFSLDDKIKVAEAKIELKKRHGIFEQAEKSRAQARIDVENAKWKNIREIVGDPKLILKIVISIIIIAMCVYAIKYGLPEIMSYLSKPRVITETSMQGLFDPKQTIEIEDLIFAPLLQNQLSDLLVRVQSAKEYKEPLPNILFYGASGTGKTAFAKALAYSSGLDYALTSGSEFAKIKNLNDANNELRKLLNWAKKSKNGVIIFIDEAESLFANRKLSSTPKAAQDFINTFLSLVSDQSQKKLMFVFATNHPFKLDDAITNRVGMNIEFTLPHAAERAQILLMYLWKFAQDNDEITVGLPEDVLQTLPRYAAGELEGFSPRAIKFVAEEMIIKSRRQQDLQLTKDIVETEIARAKNSLDRTAIWEKELVEWGGR